MTPREVCKALWVFVFGGVCFFTAGWIVYAVTYSASNNNPNSNFVYTTCNTTVIWVITTPQGAAGFGNVSAAACLYDSVPLFFCQLHDRLDCPHQQTLHYNTTNWHCVLPNRNCSGVPSPGEIPSSEDWVQSKHFATFLLLVITGGVLMVCPLFVFLYHLLMEETARLNALVDARIQPEVRRVAQVQENPYPLIFVSSSSSDQCSICLGSLVRAAMLPCTHKFCHDCITKWLDCNAHCPLCRI